MSTLLKANDGTAAVNGYDVTAEPAKVRESISLTGQFAAVVVASFTKVNERTSVAF